MHYYEYFAPMLPRRITILFVIVAYHHYTKSIFVGFEPLAIPLSDIGLNSSSSQLDLPGLSTALVPHERLPLDPPSNNNSEDEDLYMVIADSSGADGDDISTSEASDNDASENGDGDGDNEEEETFIFQVGDMWICLWYR